MKNVKLIFNIDVFIQESRYCGPNPTSHICTKQSTTLVDMASIMANTGFQ